MKDILNFPIRNDKFLTGEVEHVIPEPRFVDYDTADTRYYIDGDREPDDEGFGCYVDADNEGEMELVDVPYVVCPFCYTAFFKHDVVEFEERAREVLEPLYMDEWKAVAIKTCFDFEMLCNCPKCRHEWTIRHNGSGDTSVFIDEDDLENNSIVRNVGVYTEGNNIIAEFDICSHYIEKDANEENLVYNERIYKERMLVDIANGKTFKSYGDELKEVSFPFLRNRHISDYIEKAFTMKKDIVRAIVAKAKEMTGNENLTEEMSFYDFVTWNRFKMFSEEQRRQIEKLKFFSCLEDVEHDDNAMTALNVILENAGINICKTARKLLAEDMSRIDAMCVFATLGFTSMDALKAAINLEVFKEYTTTTCNNDMTAFCKKMIEVKGETATIRGLKADGTYYLRDSANIYFQLLENAPDLLKGHEFRGNIVEMHRRLAREYNEMSNPHIAFEFTDYEKRKFEHEIDGVRFFLPSGSDDLFEATDKMDNCVSSYWEAAYNKELYIVLAKNRRGEFVICISVDDFGRFREIKGYRNDVLPRELAEIVDKWRIKANIDPGDCSDYYKMMDR